MGTRETQRELVFDAIVSYGDFIVSQEAHDDGIEDIEVFQFLFKMFDDAYVPILLEPTMALQIAKKITEQIQKEIEDS